MPSNSDLWQRIQDFPIDDPGDAFPFSARLARVNGWSPHEAREAIEEYKKFLYLMCVATSPLIPSEVVDRVWQLHLVSTRSYWTDLCEGVLGRPIHHESVDGACAYHVLDRYADARSLYADEFDCAPPAEFWPPVSERFAAASPHREFDRSCCWPAPKSSGFGSILWCAAAALPAVIAGSQDLAAAERPEVASSTALPSMLVLAGAVALAVLVARSLRRTRKGDAGKRDGIGGVRARGSGEGYWGCSG